MIARKSSCQILLKDNACFPWILVVPEVEAEVEDLHQLTAKRQDEVMCVVREVSLFLSDYFEPDKLNVACIGNVVRQMHLHVVGRSDTDPAWPGTVWASDVKKPWPEERREAILSAAKKALG